MIIGYRTIKTAIGIALSISIAQWMGLQYYTAAGIITMICIKTTKKQSYQTAWERFFGSLAGLGISAVFFEWIGYHTWTLTLLLLVLIPMNVYLNIKDGIVSSAVVILHLYLLKDVNVEIIVNEIMLLVIGIGMAVLLNAYIPSAEKELKAYRHKIEENFKIILREFAAYLREPERYWDGKQITETAQWLKEAKELAVRDIENQFNGSALDYYQYFEMRERQFEVLERIALTVSTLNNSSEQGQMIAGFLEDVADAIHYGDSSQVFLDRLQEIRESFHNSPLPATKEEFETHAAYLYFINEMRRYLMIKKKLWKEKGEKKQKEKRPFRLFPVVRWKKKSQG
ncbi:MULTISPECIES: aromatic acid exporter family protein [Thermoactinomyces]|jgi:uncharacterized membrane protein YgaE (UPF0421/DUF939 family)|uniref:Aromatic acid exporter family protein n=1 Tax=Thermoactinomyces vulgaris TaxID=2026 RepID=A0ABS0QEU8_THEVU|nr:MULTISPECIES: aromatic acid exporter family protein [Thermoactinomyces]KYQ87470.1 hypothetical protein AYX07_01880 [Thermoactinomyces sp. AS95]MBA4551371.1 aromatic acid exporter family protein [Thermoactinomyces vulgaris]MBA4595419.1 aromatic acid exporter family protein [Thermoactinomyces vulgaris]MBH8583916.1 aromatic acid exporter family protein [Thermoactinomyces sp. CICC 10735]MBH8585303.1 aromatic acid exporter family protein [Thermoactinomyces sp. CICC 10520]